MQKVNIDESGNFDFDEPVQRNSIITAPSGTPSPIDLSFYDDLQTAVVTTNTSPTLRLRDSANGNQIGSIPKGAQVTVLGNNENGWTKVQYGSQTGYVRAQYLDNYQKI